MTPDPAVVLAETPRLVLRQLTEQDLDDLVELDSDPEVMHFITGGLPTPRRELRDDVLPAWLRYYDAGSTIGFWAASDRSSGEFVGWFHLRPGRGHGDDEPELGYRLRRDRWGQGLATEGSRSLLEVAFERGGAVRVLAETMAVNLASRRVMEKIGMTLVREFRAEWPDLIPGDEFGDVEYAIDRATWERRISSSSARGSC